LSFNSTLQQPISDWPKRQRKKIAERGLAIKTEAVGQAERANREAKGPFLGRGGIRWKAEHDRKIGRIMRRSTKN